MEQHELSFLKIIILRADIAEVIVNEGVELNIEMINEYHEFLLSHLKSPFSLLINKINAYTYDFDAQRALGTLDELNVISVVVYNELSEMNINNLATNVPRSVPWNMQMFATREDALHWIFSEQDKLTSSK